jgi:GNAT superfamily N-acetyltransferase
MCNPNSDGVHPLTSERWSDFETLFGEHGAYAGCWCTFWQLKRSEFMKMRGEERKAAMRALVDTGVVPGVMLYEEGQAIGWCSIGPREGFPPLERSKTLKRIDDQPVWSIVCFFISKTQRKNGGMTRLLKGAVDYARQQGARVVEGYPINLQAPKFEGKKLIGYSGFMGIASAFRAAGFVEVGRASETQLIMRHMIN